MKRIVLLLAVMCFQQANAAAMDVSDIPMAVENNVPLNFMFMVDNSGSMKNVVPDDPYNPSSTYLSNCPFNRQIPSGSSITLSISGGAPRINYGGNNYVLGTANGQRCFINSAIYTAELATNNIPTPTQYTGHYLNWYFGAYDGPITGWSDRKKLTSSAYKVPTRLEAAKDASVQTLDALPIASGSLRPKVRVGLATFGGTNGTTGGQLLQDMFDLNTTNLATMKTRVNNMDYLLYTPLSETLANIGRYFTLPLASNTTLRIHPDTNPSNVQISSLFDQDSTGRDSLASVPSGTSSCTGTACPVQYWCQKTQVVMLTDGRPYEDRGLKTNSYLCDYDGDSNGNCSNNDQKSSTSHSPTIHLGGAHSYEPTGSDYLNDVAQALFEIDLRPDLTAPAGRSKKNNIRTYTVGFADEQSKNDPQLQETAFQGGGIFYTADNTAQLAAALKSAVDDALAKDGAAAAVAVVNTQITIDNTAYASKYNSGYWSGDLEAYAINTTTGAMSGAAIWSAQSLLESRTSGNRYIVTSNSSRNGGLAFTAANSGLASGLVSYIRGDRSLEGTTYRKRDKLLGDIINAEPVVVKYSGTTLVYQGANDGMLHVFNGNVTTDANRGQELWAYVPRALYGKLSTYADPNYTHTFMVDATPTVADVVIGGNTVKMLVGGYGKGGAGYYALDITSPTANNENAAAGKVMWESLYNDSRIGYGYGAPLIINTPQGWRVVVASGFNNGSSAPPSGINGDGHGRVLLLNPATGAVSEVIDTNIGTAVTPSGLAYLAKPQSAGPSDVVQYVYGGDTLGNVWRFNLSSLTATKIATLTDGSNVAQPITSAPVVGAGAAANQNLVIVGTGSYLGASDVPGNTPQNSWATQRQSMYGIIDDTSVSSPSLPNIRGSNGSTCPTGGGNGDFVCQLLNVSTTTTYSGTDNAIASKRGWYLDLPVSNSRMVTAPYLTTGGAVVATINIPTNAACDPGGSSWLLNVKAANGGAILQSYGGSSYHPALTFLSNALGSRPVIIVTATEMHALVRHSDQSVSSPVVYEPPTGGGGGGTAVPWRRVYWMEIL